MSSFREAFIVTWSFLLLYLRPLPSKETMTSLELSFVNDAVSTTFFHRARRLPIIPDYDATTDPQVQRYIQTPRVRRVLEVTLQGKVSSLPGVLRVTLQGKVSFSTRGPTGHSTGQGEFSTRDPTGHCTGQGEVLYQRS